MLFSLLLLTTVLFSIFILSFVFFICKNVNNKRLFSKIKKLQTKPKSYEFSQKPSPKMSVKDGTILLDTIFEIDSSQLAALFNEISFQDSIKLLKILKPSEKRALINALPVSVTLKDKIKHKTKEDFNKSERLTLDPSYMLVGASPRSL